MAQQEEPTHGAAMRRALLKQLPALEHRGGAVLAALDLDQDSDLRSAIEVDVDTFLTPLAATTRGGRR
jgi:hypothetical protein